MILLWIITAMLGIAIFSVVISYVIYHMAFEGNRKITTDPYKNIDGEDLTGMRAGIDRMLGEPYESVSITSRDGITLVGKYYHRRDGAPLEIQMHGFRGMPERDFSGGGPECLDMGHNLLLVHQRAHGVSGGDTITYGVLERYDALSWAEWAHSRFGEDVKIFLMGISMGASTVIMASALDLPRNVVGIIADCPYSSPVEIITKVAEYMRLPGRLLSPFVRLAATLFGKFSLADVTCETAVKASRTKILIIHGADDHFVPEYMSEKIEAAAPEIVRRITFPGADHGMSYSTDTERYMKIVKEFMAECLEA